MVGTAGGRRAVLALACCGAGYLAVSLLRIGRDSAGPGGFVGGDPALDGQLSAEMAAVEPEGGLARIAATVVVEPQAFASVRLKVVDPDHSPLAGVRARLKGARAGGGDDGGGDFEATTES